MHASTDEIWLPQQGCMGVLSLLFLVMDSTRGSQMFTAAPEQMLFAILNMSSATQQGREKERKKGKRKRGGGAKCL